MFGAEWRVRRRQQAEAHRHGGGDLARAALTVLVELEGLDTGGCGPGSRAAAGAASALCALEEQGRFIHKLALMIIKKRRCNIEIEHLFE